MDGYLQRRERFITAGSAARWWQPTFLPASASCSRALSSPASMMHQYRTAQLRLQRLTAVAGAQRLNASTPQRLNASTQTRQMHGFRPGASSATPLSSQLRRCFSARDGPAGARSHDTCTASGPAPLLQRRCLLRSSRAQGQRARLTQGTGGLLQVSQCSRIAYPPPRSHGAAVRAPNLHAAPPFPTQLAAHGR